MFNDTCRLDTNDERLVPQIESSFNDLYNQIISKYPSLVSVLKDDNGSNGGPKLILNRKFYEFVSSASVNEFKDGTFVVSSARYLSKNPDGTIVYPDNTGKPLDLLGPENDDCVFMGGTNSSDKYQLKTMRVSCVYNDLEQSFKEAVVQQGIDADNAKQNQQMHDIIKQCPQIVKNSNKYFISRYQSCLNNYDNTTCNNFFERDQDGYIKTHGDYTLCLSYNPFYKLVSIPN